MSAPAIGRLDERITVQNRTDTADGSGGYSSSWGALATAWALVEELSARERYFAGKVEHNVTHRVVMRYRTDVTSDMRLLRADGSTVLQIRGVREGDGRKRWTILDCEQGVGS